MIFRAGKTGGPNVPSDDRYDDGYKSGVRDAQIELINALVDLRGARDVTIHGYNVSDPAEETDLSALPVEERWRLRCVFLQRDVGLERQRAKAWQKLAGVYDDIRYALRNAPDTPEGHTEFYHECARLIFDDHRLCGESD